MYRYVPCIFITVQTSGDKDTIFIQILAKYITPQTQTTKIMSDVPQSPLHVSGRREPDEPPHHGINVGSGLECREHSYSNIDNDGKAVKRDESLTEILISKGVQEVNLISAIVSLGEGE